jgi:selT/selW/selH-like putative selenoprotein
VRRALEARFPDLEVVGTNYPPGARALLHRQRSALNRPTCSAGEGAAGTRRQLCVHGCNRRDAGRRGAVSGAGPAQPRLSEKPAGVEAANLRRRLVHRQHRRVDLLCCVATLTLACAVQQNLISTGAFEVFYDGRTLFSKLATGAAPQLSDIVRAVSEAHRAALQIQLT